MNPVQILLLIREGKVTDWESLCRSFGIRPEEDNTGAYYLAKTIEDLHLAGIVSLESEIRPRVLVFPKGKIQLSENWGRIQTVLGLSLKEMAQVDRSRSMWVEPYFGRPMTHDSTGQHDLFMLMPFEPELKRIYDDHIRHVAEKVGLTIKRADDFFTSHEIMHDVWSSIFSARAVIADCTNRNPNVFYEIGIAHTVGKPVVLITQKHDDVPFDLRAIRYIQYTYTPPGMREFEQKLELTLKEVLSSTKVADMFV